MLEGGGPGYPPPARLLCPSIRLYLGPSTRGRARRGGSGGGLPPPGTAAVSKHQTISGTQHEGACSRGRVRGGGLPPPGTAAVSKHQTISGTQHEGACSRGGVRGGGVTPPGTAAVSKHQTVTFVFVLKITLPRRNLASLCPGRREVRLRISTPLQHLRF